MAQLVSYTQAGIDVPISDYTFAVNHQTGGIPYSVRFEDSAGRVIPFSWKPDYENGLEKSRILMSSSDTYANIKVFILSLSDQALDVLPIL